MQRNACCSNAACRGGNSARPFLLPVDAARDQADKYHDIISRPMDLSTIKGKLERAAADGGYAKKEELMADLQLMLSNCYTYNSTPRHWLRKIARELEVRRPAHHVVCVVMQCLVRHVGNYCTNSPFVSKARQLTDCTPASLLESVDG